MGIKMKSNFNRIRNWADQNIGLLTLLGVAITAMGFMLPWFIQALLSVIGVTPKAISLFQQHREPVIWFGFLLFSFSLIRLFYVFRNRLSSFDRRLQIVETHPEVLLHETVAANLSNWSFNGQWSLDDGVIGVTKENPVGIFKSGASWENYKFSFEFRIMNKAAGWIVRAMSSDKKFVMIQCNNQQIRPHLFWPGESDVREIDHKLSLNAWNKAKTKVHGHSIKVYINDTLVFSDSELLTKYPMGTVGFRCWGDEHALFRKIKVVKL